MKFRLAACWRSKNKETFCRQSLAVVCTWNSVLQLAGRVRTRKHSVVNVSLVVILEAISHTWNFHGLQLFVAAALSDK